MGYREVDQVESIDEFEKQRALTSKIVYWLLFLEVCIIASVLVHACIMIYAGHISLSGEKGQKEGEVVETEPVVDYQLAILGAGNKGDRRYAEAERRFYVCKQAIEKHLGAFQTPVTLHLVEHVTRKGQALQANRSWTGTIRYEASGPVIELSYEAFKKDEDLRFYLAHVRMHEREKEIQSEAVRVGLAHLLRTEDGMDHHSLRLYRKSPLLEFGGDLSLVRLKDDAEYRDSARASCWASLYLLRKKGMSYEQLLTLKTSELPNPNSLEKEFPHLLNGK